MKDVDDTVTVGVHTVPCVRVTDCPPACTVEDRPDADEAMVAVNDPLPTRVSVPVSVVMSVSLETAVHAQPVPVVTETVVDLGCCSQGRMPVNDSNLRQSVT